MGAMANCEDTDEMQHYAAFHQGLHCLLRQNRSALFAEARQEMQFFFLKSIPVTPQSIFREKKCNIIFEIITCDPSVYINGSS